MTQTRLLPTGMAPPARTAQRPKSRYLAKQWELVEFAAKGSLARVYQARPAEGPADRPAAYAVKMLRRCWRDDPTAIRLLQREALIGRTVSHPHLAPVLAASVLDAPRLIAMPWLEGDSLQSCLAISDPFSPAKALWIARQAAEALDALHTAGWTHGDVTPGNIMVSPTGHVTLIDLSFARRRDETGSAVDRPIMGTCGYLAPEYFTSALQPDIRSDIYSLGVVLYEMLSGRPPYTCTTLAELAHQHRQLPPANLVLHAPETPREVASLVRRMMARDPMRRPQTPRELILQLVSLEIGVFCER